MSIVLDTKDFGEVRDVKGGVVGSLGEVASTVLGSKNTVSSGNVESVNNVGSIGNVGSLGNVDLGSIGSLGNTGSLNNVNETKKLVNLELTSSATTVNAASEAKVEVKPEPVAYKQYKYRYIIMFLYFLLSNASGITGPVCAPIITNLTKIYGVSQTVVNLSTLISMIVYIPATIPGNWILERYGIKVGIIIGTALMVGGVWLRLLAKTSFTWVLLGQLLASIGGPLLSNCPQKISAYWTAPGSRTMFTTLLMLSGVVGGSLGFILPGWIVGEESSPELGKELFVKLLLIEAIVCSVLCIPVFIFFREKPPTPPCASAEVKRESDRAGYKLLLKNRPFLWLLAQQGCVLGAINALITTIQSLIDPFGYTQYQASAMGVIVNVASVLGCLIFGCYVQKVRKFKIPMIYSGFIALACYGMFTGVIYSHNFYALAGVTFVLGFVLAPCGPLALEFACEITFPVGEALSGGIILSIIQVVCPAQTFIIGAIMEREDKRQGTLYTMIMLMVFMVVGILCSFKIKEDLKRSAHDRNHGKATEKAKEETPETPCPLVENVEVSPADVIIQETKKPEAL